MPAVARTTLLLPENLERGSKGSRFRVGRPSKGESPLKWDTRIPMGRVGFPAESLVQVCGRHAASQRLEEKPRLAIQCF